MRNRGAVVETVGTPSLQTPVILPNQLAAGGGDVLAFAEADVHHHVATLQYINETLAARWVRFVK